MTADQPPQSHHHVSHTQQQQHQQPARKYLDYLIPMAKAIPDYLPYGLRYDTEEENLAFIYEIRQAYASLCMGLPRLYMY